MYPAHMDGNAIAPETDHEITPRKDTSYSMSGPNAGQQANLLNFAHYPVEAFCLECGEVVRSEDYMDTWRHTGRKPGDPR